MPDDPRPSAPDLRPAFPDTRWSLIGRIGQDGVTSQVVERYAYAIDRYLRLKLPTDAARGDFDDIVQDVLIHLLERPGVLAQAKPGVNSRFRYYLMTVAWNEARNALRRRRRIDGKAVMVSDEAIALTAPDADQALLMDRAWAAAVVSRAWADLQAGAAAGTVDADVPRILAASLIDGRSLRDLAAETGLSLATCQRRLARGRLLLQQAMSESLRHAGELDAGTDSSAACERLLEMLRREG